MVGSRNHTEELVLLFFAHYGGLHSRICNNATIYYLFLSLVYIFVLHDQHNTGIKMAHPKHTSWHHEGISSSVESSNREEVNHTPES